MSFCLVTSMALYVDYLGHLQVHAGVLATVYSLAALAVRPLIGVLSDKYGRVKLLIIGAAFCGVTTVLFGFTGVLAVLIVIRSFNGAAFGIHSTCAGAAAADVLPKEKISEGIGIFTLSSTLAQAIGPWVALSIVAGGTMSDYRLLFFILMGICAFSTAANCCVTYERKRKQQTISDNTVALESPETEEIATPCTSDLPDSETVLPKTFMGFEYAVFAPAAVLILVYIAISGIVIFMAPFAASNGIENSGLYFTVSAFGIFVSRIIFGRVADKRGSDIVIIPGLLLMALGMAILPFVSNLTGLILMAIPLGFAQGMAMPTFNSMLFTRCSPARRGTANGAFFAAVDVGFAVGGPMLGALADARDFRFVFWASAILMALALVLYIMISSDKRFLRKGASV